MNKPRLLITVRGGIIQHIASTSKNVEIQIINYDNLEDGNEHNINQLDEIKEPDLVMRRWDMDTSIKILKKQYNK